jgi:hypothetical protein
MRKARAVSAAMLLALALGACVARSSEPLPRAVSEYLQALRSGDYGAAYARTSFSKLARVGPGVALTEAHFAAFYRANPLQRYSVSRVLRLDRRALDSPQEPGTPVYSVKAELVFPDGVRREEFTVEGDVLGVVEVEPDSVRVHDSAAAGRARALVVDGVPTARPPGATAADFALLLIRGTHDIRVGDSSFELTTDPLGVGPGSVAVGSGVVVVR